MNKPSIPAELPPKDIDYIELLPFIIKAHDVLSELKGLLINLPNYKLLTTPLITKEAVLSSKIEGTQATLSDVFKYEAEDKKSQLDEKERDVKEILNYREAMSQAILELRKKPLGENLIKKLHKTLLDSVRGQNKNRGNFRNTQVYIGQLGSPIEKAKYIPPPVTEMPRLLSNWENFINSDEEMDPLVQIGIAHYQFEAIHPFLDGNGRIGRLLIPLFLYMRDYLPYPLLYISEYFEEYNKAYRTYLNEVDVNYNWTDWLKFFLTGIKVQSIKTQITTMKILALYNELKEKISTTNAVYAVNLLDVIFTTPIITFTSIRKCLRTNSRQTIYNLIDKFVDLGILKEISGQKRNRMFAFEQLLNVLKSK